MTPKRLILAALFAVAALSCTSDKTGPDGNEPEGKPVKVSFAVGLEEALTRATFPFATATKNEKHITNVGLFIFNNQRKLHKAFEEDYIRAQAENGSGITTGYVNFAFELPEGRYYAFAVANVPKGHLTYAYEGMTTEEFSQALMEYDLDILTGRGFFEATTVQDKIDQQSRGFFMTPLNGFVEFWAVDTEGGDGVLDSSANNVKVELGRAVAKVALAFEPKEQVNGTLHDVEYIITNNPSTMYAVPQYSGSALITPNYNDNWVNPDHYQEPLDSWIPAIDGTTANAGNHTFCMENSNKTPKQGNATMAMIKGTFKPTDLLNADGTQYTGPRSSDTFWMVATVHNGKNYYNAGKYYIAEPDASELTPQDPGEVLVPVEFEDGVCYYGLWLRNPDSGNENPYTVKRNSYYTITVNSVSGAGVPDPGEVVDPEIPLDKSIKIDAVIQVVNWNLIEDEQGI